MELIKLRDGSIDDEGRRLDGELDSLLLGLACRLGAMESKWALI